MEDSQPPFTEIPHDPAQLEPLVKTMLEYLDVEFKKADANAQALPVIEHVGAQFQKLVNNIVTLQCNEAETMFQDDKAPFENRAAVGLKDLPPFLLCAAGSISRNEMAPYSDFDLVILLLNNTSYQDLCAVSDWWRRYARVPGKI